MPRLVYRAIRLARPRRLGKGEDTGCSTTSRPITLREAMRLAADRDLVARQYAHGFADVFDHALPSLRAAIEQKVGPLETAIIFAYLDFLAHRPGYLDRPASVARRPPSKPTGRPRAPSWTPAGPTPPGGSEGHCRPFDDELGSELDGHARNPRADRRPHDRRLVRRATCGWDNHRCQSLGVWSSREMK